MLKDWKLLILEIYAKNHFGKRKYEEHIARLNEYIQQQKEKLVHYKKSTKSK
ncbi:hypothetical protein KHA80_22440 [Anaerobacillus sp. HL2]|nr:hypothetical protein KHA80_22440 [Anaerobacillus sp. HL2]